MMQAPVRSQPEACQGWRAHLELAFARRDGLPILALNRHTGPLRLQRPLFPEKDVCHAYILHPPGGVVGGDQLVLDAAVNTDAAALITTPGAGKFYRSDDQWASQKNRLTVSDGGCLEWLPQETIVYSGAMARVVTRVRLEGAAKFIGWEIVCLGLPACGRPLDSGRLFMAMEIYRDDRPLFIDRLSIRDATDIARPTGLRGFTVTATFVATGCRREMVTALRDLAGDHAGMETGITCMDDMIVARVLCDDSWKVKVLFQSIWSHLRPVLTGRDACFPRIWET